MELVWPLRPLEKWWLRWCRFFNQRVNSRSSSAIPPWVPILLFWHILHHSIDGYQCGFLDGLHVLPSDQPTLQVCLFGNCPKLQHYQRETRGRACSVPSQEGSWWSEDCLCQWVAGKILASRERNHFICSPEFSCLLGIAMCPKGQGTDALENLSSWGS